MEELGRSHLKRHDNISQNTVNNNEEDHNVEDSLEFCADIYRYYKRSSTVFGKDSSVYVSAYKKSDAVHEVSAVDSIALPSIKDEKAADVLLILKRMVIAFFIIFAITLFARTFLIQETVVEGSSMSPVLSDGDRLLLLKKSLYHKPSRYDVVVFTTESGGMYIKRIIGLPGEDMIIKKGRVYINDELLYTDPLGSDTMKYSGNAAEHINVPVDNYFVLGDNRNNSYDSRFKDVGFVDIKRIKGKVILRIWPLKRFGFIN